MLPDTHFRRLYSCGTRVSGHGRPAKIDSVSPSRAATRTFASGIVIMMPARKDDLYTILDEVTFGVLESREDEIYAVA